MVDEMIPSMFGTMQESDVLSTLEVLDSANFTEVTDTAAAAAKEERKRI